MTKQRRAHLLFLVRAYNDLDHFAPIIRHLAQQGQVVRFAFTDQWRPQDYRVKLCVEAGARHADLSLLTYYHFRFRQKFVQSSFVKIWDWSFGLGLGLFYLLSLRPGRIVVEWGGPSGRGVARYILAPARKLGIPCFSLPHGYHIWTNRLVTNSMVSLGPSHEKFNFKNRNQFSAYVVQSENVKKFFFERDIDEEKIRVLGSPRFSPEWCEINLREAQSEVKDSMKDIPRPYVVVFLGNWDYRIDKLKCLNLLSRLALIPGIHVVIRGHSRGDLIGGLTSSDLKRDGLRRCIYSDGSIHSNCLIFEAIAVINFASSIGLEAIIQGRPICNPVYLTENTTIFKGSGLVVDAFSDTDVVDFVRRVMSNKKPYIVDPGARDKFITEHIYGGLAEEELLARYEELLLMSKD
jgi:hypothetical protein